MPTGYTADIEKLTFNQFVWKCARAFGAFIMQRDDRMDAPPCIEEAPNSYYEDSLKRAKSGLAAYQKLSKEQKIKQAKSEQEDSIKRIKKSIMANKVLLAIYQEKLQQALRWVPPSENHRNLKDFMIQQIQDSIEHDCNIEYYEKALAETQNQNLESEIINEELRLIRDVEYYTKKCIEEHERVAERNNWKRQLLDSVPLK